MILAVRKRAPASAEQSSGTSRRRFKFSKPSRLPHRKADEPNHPTDPYVDPLTKAYVDTVSDFIDNIDPQQLELDLQGQSDPSAAFNLSQLDAQLEVALAPIVTNLMQLGVDQESTAIFDFALPNLEAVAAAQSYTAWLVQQITDETRTGIQNIMYRAFTEGLAPRDSGKLIADALRGEPLDPRLAARFGIMSAGLNSRLANAVFNFAQNLTTQGYSSSSVMAKAQAYSERLLQYRGNLIARTETIRASSIGQQAVWDSAIDGGYLDSATTTKMWSAAPQKRTCELCLNIDGQEVKVSDQFDTPWGPLDGPPGHGDCRCSAILRFNDVQPPRESARDRLAQSVSSQLAMGVANLPDLSS